MITKILNFLFNRPEQQVKPLQNEVRITSSGVSVTKYNKELVKETMKNLTKQK